MDGRLVLVVALATAPLIGCIGADDEAVDPATLDGLLAPATPIVAADPLKAPHPAYGWPTLTHIPEDAPAWWHPIEPVPLPERITGISHVANQQEGDSAGAGMAVFGSIAIVPQWIVPGTGISPPVRVIDISDPEDPQIIARMEPGMAARDADVIAYPDGRVLTVLATDSYVVPVYDITDPKAPVEVTMLEPPGGAHNVAVVPGTPILYNSNTGGRETTGFWAPAASGAPSKGQVEIYDFSDPTAPVLVKEWKTGFGCHDITFHITAERARAYCAAIDVTQIWDITDPLAPSVITTIPFPHADARLPTTAVTPVTYSHMAMVDHTGTILIVGDETGGGPGHGCDRVADSVNGPLGNIWFYDITDETAPRLLSYIAPEPYYADNPPPHAGELPVAGCTAHFADQIPIEGQDVLAVAYFGGGIVLIDFTDPTAPFILDEFKDGSQSWDVWFVQGHLFSSGLSRDLDVFRFT